MYWHWQRAAWGSPINKKLVHFGNAYFLRQQQNECFYSLESKHQLHGSQCQWWSQLSSQWPLKARSGTGMLNPISSNCISGPISRLYLYLMAPILRRRKLSNLLDLNSDHWSERLGCWPLNLYYCQILRWLIGDVQCLTSHFTCGIDWGHNKEEWQQDGFHFCCWRKNSTQVLRRRQLEWNCGFALERLGLSKFFNIYLTIVQSTVISVNQQL